MKKDLCIFVNYNVKETIPYYVLFFLKELEPYFDEIILSTNIRTINNLHELPKNCTISMFKNEGYDFGFFYKTIQSIEIQDYKRIAFINDSNILFQSLNSIFRFNSNRRLDMWGVTDSNEQQYHIQSHFLVFEEKAIKLLNTFFDDIQFTNYLSNSKDIRQKIINTCEIGITQYMMKKGLTAEGIYKYSDFQSEYNKQGFVPNIHVKYWSELIVKGYPLIKKKIVLDEFPKHKSIPSFLGWRKLISRFAKSGLQIEKLIQI